MDAVIRSLFSDRIDLALRTIGEIHCLSSTSRITIDTSTGTINQQLDPPLAYLFILNYVCSSTLDTRHCQGRTVHLQYQDPNYRPSHNTDWKEGCVPNLHVPSEARQSTGAGWTALQVSRSKVLNYGELNEEQRSARLICGKFSISFNIKLQGVRYS